MKEILIVCAMEKEAIKISKKLNLEKVENNIYRRDRITLLISGIGKQRTAIIVAMYICKNKKPDIIVNIGYAGSTDIEIGKWANITKSYNYEWDIPGEEKYSMLDLGNQNLLLLEKENNLENVECYTAESFVTSTSLKGHIAFDMELHSLALICDMNSIELISLKKISDNLSLDKYYENLKKENVFELESAIEILKKSNVIE